MKPFSILPGLSLRGRIILPGDKSIAHRALILGAISNGVTTLGNFPDNKDLKTTINIFLKLGIKIKIKENKELVIFGKGLTGLRKSGNSLFIAESGTTFRLLLGILAGQDFEANLTTGIPLSKRPMLRVIAPLRNMGALIKSRKIKKDEYPPITIKGGNLKGITYRLPVASAQVKSAIMFAGLYAEGKTRVIETIKTRDHTERLFRAFKAGIQLEGNAIVIERKKKLLISPGRIYIPGDFSSAAFFMVAAIILPGSEILLKNISLNPSRLGMLRALKRMGAHINTFDNKTGISSAYEPLGDILVKNSKLKGISVGKKEIPSLIDELPILMVASCFARGETIFEGVKELRVKETDRIRSMLYNLKNMGADIRVARRRDTENIVIKGVGKLKGASLKSFGDHRTAMSAIIAGFAADGSSRIDDVSCISKSFPGFVNLLMTLRA